MWIIPKHPLLTSACAPDTEGSTLGSKELSIMCEQSLLVKSKPTPSKTWQQRLKRDTSTQRLFGLILKPSRGASFTERWTSSAEASLVSHSAPQDGEPVTTTLDTYGHTSHEELESWADLPLFSSKMLRGSYPQGSAATTGATPQERPFCCISSASWNEWITAQRQEYSARAKQAPPTSESGCSYLARAMTSAPRAALLFQDCSRTQSAEAWRTPSTSDVGREMGLITKSGEPWRGEGRAYRPDGTNKQQTLNAQVEAISAQNLPTPTTQETPHPQATLTETGQVLLGPADEEPRNTHGSPRESQSVGQLNPRWVETLMGLPVGWTMASCSTPWTIEPTSSDYSETELYQQQQSALSESSGSAWATPKAGACGMTARTSGRPIEKSTQLTTQVHLEECKAWGTPRVGTANAHPKAGARGPNTEHRLENQVLEESGDTWPTPQARDHKGSSGRSNKGLELDLPAAVKAIIATTTTPTPTGTPNNEPST